MNRLCILVGTTILGYAGWTVGEALSFKFVGSFLLSGLGSLIGVWAGWRFARRFA
jgi:hypothetical protein